jgi:hypothetical protein
MTSPEVARAGKLLRWLVERDTETISLRDIQYSGPSTLREAEIVKETVQVLVAHGLCRLETGQTGGRPSTLLILSPYAEGAF